MRKLICVCCALYFGSFAGIAGAQVFSGVSSNGVILLSSQQIDDEQELLIAAEAAPGAVPNSSAANFSKAIPQAFAAFIREASTTYRLPEPLIHAVISVESNYNPAARSRKGAQGLMQLMPATARRFGNLNPLDARQNILTGSRYLRWLLDYFAEDLELSVAAYNAGEGAVMQAGRKIPHILETERYVPKVLSLYRQFMPPS